MIIREYYQPSAPDPVLEPDLVLSLVRRHLPQATAVTAVDESGGEARSYYIDADVVMKVQRPPQLRSWTSLEKEVVFLRQIAQDDPALPVPRVLGYGREGTVEYTCLTRMAGDAAVRTPIPEAIRHKTLSDLGRTVRRVHAIQQAPLRESGLFPEEFTPDDLRQSIREDITDLAGRLAAQGVDWPLAMPAAQVADKLASLVPERTVAIALHTNPGPTHTFVDAASGRFTGLIDFGDAYIGHPVFDLWQWGDPEDRQAVLDGYLAAGPVDPSFSPLWQVAEVISDLVAIVRDRPYKARSAAHLAQLAAAW